MALELPATTETSPEPDYERPAPRTERTKPRILIVDDDAAVARLFARVLEKYDVQWAESGGRAKAFLQDSSYDAILSDISMPEMDGIQFLREVRRVDLDVPVILVTGSPHVETAIKALEHGALRYLVKPVEPAELQKIVAYAVQIHELAKIKREAMGLLGEKVRADSDRARLREVFSSALGSLWMAYQPIVCWSERRIVAYEALVRSREPALPHPGALLAAAQSLGGLHELRIFIRSAPRCPLTQNGWFSRSRSVRAWTPYPIRQPDWRSCVPWATSWRWTIWLRAIRGSRASFS